MADEKSPGNGRLEEALATVLQTQATFLARLADIERTNGERFERIERLLLRHEQFLQDHTRLLEALPEAVREKIGFKAPGA